MESVKIRWPEGNTLPLCVKLRQIVVVEGGSNYGDYIPPAGSVVTAQLINRSKVIDYEVTLDGNKVYFTDDGTLSAGEYGIVINVTEPDRKLRSFKYGQLVIIREADNLKLGDYLVDNAVTLTADAFIFGKGDKGDQGEPGTTDYNELENKPTIPSELSQLSEDTTHRVVTDTEKNTWNGKQDAINDLSEIRSGAQAGATAVQTETDPTVPSWAKQQNKPSYNASEVGALSSSTKYGATIDMSLNTTDYKLTVSLKDQVGTVLNSKVVDFPIESVVVNGSYDSTNKKIVLTLQNGNTIDVPVGDIVAGLQSEITALNMLDADLVDDTNSTHKFVTTSEKSTWNGKYDKPASGIPATDLAAGVIPDISGKADKSEMSVADGTGADADKTTITLKSGTSATVLKSHQALPTTMGASGSGHKGGLVPDTPSTAGTTKFLREDGTWQEPAGGGGAAAYTPTLQSAPASSTTTYIKDGQTVDFEIGQFCRVLVAGSYDFYQLYNISNNVATWEKVVNRSLKTFCIDFQQNADTIQWTNGYGQGAHVVRFLGVNVASVKVSYGAVIEEVHQLGLQDFTVADGQVLTLEIVRTSDGQDASLTATFELI